MGYSLSVKFKNLEEQQKMYDFYISNTDIIEKLSLTEGRNDSQYYTDLCWDDNLSYAPKAKFLFGYDGPSGRPYYLELLLAWMAVKSTYRDKTNQPFIYYDSEKTYVNEKNNFLIKVNEKGIQSCEEFFKNDLTYLSFSLYGVSNIQEYGKKVEDLFNELEQRWQSLNNEWSSFNNSYIKALIASTK